MSGDVCTKMGAERTALALQEDLEIPSRLSPLDYAERIFLARHRQIEGVVARDLQEAAGEECAKPAACGRSRAATGAPAEMSLSLWNPPRPTMCRLKLRSDHLIGQGDCGS